MAPGTGNVWVGTETCTTFGHSASLGIKAWLLHNHGHRLGLKAEAETADVAGDMAIFTAARHGYAEIGSQPRCRMW